MYLEKINSPSDLKALSASCLPALAEEIRQEILQTVSRNGGHLASNLGTVELTIALHRVFDVPQDRIFFDVGHQCYTHKLLTGRREIFRTLRQLDGCSGFPVPAESPCDPAYAGHSGSAVSTALGYAAADPGDRSKVIAVVGDGSLGNGASLEGLNSTRSGGKRLLVILNDNKMSISPNVGTIARSLNRVISGHRYNSFKDRVRKFFRRLPRYERILKALSRMETSLKHVLLPPEVFFESLGLRYMGPVNGHDLPGLLGMLEKLKTLEGPILLHIVTEKGHGCSFAVKEPSRYHGVGGFDPETGKLPASEKSFSRVFGETMMRLAEREPRLVAVSAAMLEGTGLKEFAAKYPARCFDAGIAEEHAALFCAGLAGAGKRPVFAVYSTFLQRALDCIACDVALPGLPVVLAVDRSGIVEDGPTHHGIYVPGFLRQLPGVELLFPADGRELALLLEYAVTADHPVALCYPRGSASDVPGFVPEPFVPGTAQVVRKGSDAVLWALGRELETALAAAELLASGGMEITVVNVRTLAPFDGKLANELVALPQFTLEDASVEGGLGSVLGTFLAERPAPAGVLTRFGWPKAQIPHGKAAALRERFGLDAPSVARRIREALGGTGSENQ